MMSECMVFPCQLSVVSCQAISRKEYPVILQAGGVPFDRLRERNPNSVVGCSFLEITSVVSCKEQLTTDN
ncbi:hypothetical protein QUF80_09580 [Desulfococcaceae bacterium HSG8]|nr:hypothetical protein [Desulfococcaceae bacterium HSG8]